MSYPLGAADRRNHRAHITAVKITRAKVEAEGVVLLDQLRERNPRPLQAGELLLRVP